MPKYHVLLDTNIYRKNPSRSDLPFQALQRLCQQKVVSLHIPYVVEREFQTQQVSLYKKELDTATSALDAVIRKGLSATQLASTRLLRDQISAAAPAILTEVKESLPTWASAIGAIRHTITSAQALAAMEAYFLGSPPLKSPKTREDIPDSFIFQTVLELASTPVPLVVIAEDEKMAQASEAIAGVTVHRSLAAFMESSPIQTEILELDVVENLPALTDLISTYEEEVGALNELITQKGADKLVWKKVHSNSIPDDNHEGIITGHWNPENIEFDYTEFSYFGQGEFGLPFTFSTTVSITYYIFKSDYFLIDEDKMPAVSDHNDHYYEAESDIEVKVTGLIKLSIAPSALKTIDASSLEDHLSIEIDSIDSVEVVE